MNVQPTLELHPHQEFHFADNTDSQGCCCFWKSKSKPKEYVVDERNVLHPRSHASVRERIISNQRLANILVRKFEDDAVDNEEAFQELKRRINDPMNNGQPITDEKLVRIVNELYALKKEFKGSK